MNETVKFSFFKNQTKTTFNLYIFKNLFFKFEFKIVGLTDLG